MKFEDLIEVRKEMKARKPHFKRHDRNKLARLARSGWRKSVQGHDNKNRNRYAGNEKAPTPGYGSPKLVRGMHASGLFEILVHNVSELNGIDAKKYAVRIAATVGNKKKIDVVEAARKLNLKILNPKYIIKSKKKSVNEDVKTEKLKEKESKTESKPEIKSTNK
ncbi:MAG: 50S ribosomal protein L32e [Nanoarchaeota archaeon]|nr:50S ribosomal protein L32e [Nanoarchaeota archaeon]MBU4300770.1 50S ribosomal protein L32e [Nanoarchaeota archaeon]MBU4452362.1 50S ribosomal protein L32e [Nanoarchaeota archaeon]MCG2723362.1 50S ribosomal protein L32e [archaeon]